MALIRGSLGSTVDIYTTRDPETSADADAYMHKSFASPSPTMGYLMKPAETMPSLEETALEACVQASRNSVTSTGSGSGSKKGSLDFASDICHHHRIRRICKVSCDISCSLGEGVRTANLHCLKLGSNSLVSFGRIHVLHCRVRSVP